MPAGEDRVVNPIVAPLTDNLKIRALQSQVRRVAHLDDVVDDQSLLGLSADGAAMPRFESKLLSEPVPRSPAQVRPRILDSSSVQEIGRPGECGQVGGVALLGAKPARGRAWTEHRSAGVTWPLKEYDPVGSRACEQSPMAGRSAGFAGFGWPVSDLGAADRTRVNDSVIFSRAISKLASPRASDLWPKGRSELDGADWAGFQHDPFYHVQDDKTLITDSVLASAIAAFQVVDGGQTRFY